MGKLFAGTNAPVPYGPFFSFGLGGYSTQFNSEYFANGRIYSRVNGDGGFGNWYYLYSSGMIDQLKSDLNLPTSGGYDLQSVTSRGNVLNNPIVLNSNGYFMGEVNHGVRFNDSQSLYNNFIIRENGDTYTRGNVGVGTGSPSSKLHVYQSQPDQTGLIVQGNTINSDGVDHYVGITLDGDYGNQIGNYSQIRSNSNLYRYWGSKLSFHTTSSTQSNTLKERMIIDGNGDVGIGTSTPKEKLSVNGKIRAHEVKVETSGWPDYVFEDDYKVTSLVELEKFIKVNKHLPEVPSAKEVGKNGVELGEMNKILLKKIEEITLLLIDQAKHNARQDETIKKLILKQR